MNLCWRYEEDGLIENVDRYQIWSSWLEFLPISDLVYNLFLHIISYIFIRLRSDVIIAETKLKILEMLTIFNSLRFSVSWIWIDLRKHTQASSSWTELSILAGACNFTKPHLKKIKMKIRITRLRKWRSNAANVRKGIISMIQIFQKAVPNSNARDASI